MSDRLCINNERGIVIYEFLDSADATVDAWAADLERLIAATPADVPFRVLMDVSAAHVNFTRHARQTSVLLFTRYGQRRGRLAFLFSSKTAPHFARIFFASLGKLTFERDYFSNRAKAMAWLQSVS